MAKPTLPREELAAAIRHILLTCGQKVDDLQPSPRRADTNNSVSLRFQGNRLVVEQAQRDSPAPVSCVKLVRKRRLELEGTFPVNENPNDSQTIKSCDSTAPPPLEYWRTTLGNSSPRLRPCSGRNAHHHRSVAPAKLTAEGFALRPGNKVMEALTPSRSPSIRPETARRRPPDSRLLTTDFTHATCPPSLRIACPPQEPSSQFPNSSAQRRPQSAPQPKHGINKQERFPFLVGAHPTSPPCERHVLVAGTKYVFDPQIFDWTKIPCTVWISKRPICYIGSRHVVYEYSEMPHDRCVRSTGALILFVSEHQDEAVVAPHNYFPFSNFLETRPPQDQAEAAVHQSLPRSFYFLNVAQMTVAHQYVQRWNAAHPKVTLALGSPSAVVEILPSPALPDVKTAFCGRIDDPSPLQLEAPPWAAKSFSLPPRASRLARAVSLDYEDPEVFSAALGAFTHFTIFASRCTLLAQVTAVVSGVVMDVVIHTIDGVGFGKANRGRQAFLDFFQLHTCTDTCRQWGVPPELLCSLSAF
eukprot:TRINITY_DN4294_c0_g2_i1.p1 TRINITY_DN4294_c0_g2~~TRINITY_DN4294_c0_g2_i1.p1  ORF type:complete len:528 (+),score=45.41 TRINITY_DN4294_c0_g2_i1:22-1605(+)